MLWIIGVLGYLFSFGLGMLNGQSIDMQKDIGQFLVSNTLFLAVVFGASYIFNRTMLPIRRASVAFAIVGGLVATMSVVMALVMHS